MTDKKTAPAGKDAVRQPQVIEGGTLTEVIEGSYRFPALSYEGDAPKAGDVLKFTHTNGVQYSGTATEVIEASGDVLAVFAGGVTPTPTK